MPVNADKKYGKAAKWFRTIADMNMSEAMRAAGFSPEEAKDDKFRKRVERTPEYKQYANYSNEVAAAKDTVGNGDTPTSNVTPDVVMLPAPDHPSTPTKKKSTRTRSTHGQKAKKVAARKAATKRKSAATKVATTRLAREWGKNQAISLTSPIKGARQICIDVNRQFGTNLSFSTITRYTREGLIGVSPKKKGPEGMVPPRIFKVLCRAFETFIRINQGNGNGAVIERKQLISIVNRVTAPLFPAPKYTPNLYERLVMNTEIDFGCHVQEKVEDRRIRWTTYSNLKLWFETWAEDLLELGFAKEDENGDILIPLEQLSRILNLDESCLTLDGNKSRRGGRPSTSLYDPSLPQPGKTTSKSSVALTFIGGSNANHEALPPHLQFSSSAKTEERQQIRLNVAHHLQGVSGTWGLKDGPKIMPVTLGVNEKGGMDEAEFEKYIRNSILPLYSETTADVPGKRVIIKVDSGPGRLNYDMLARLRNHGFYVYPGVPNTTSVSQETDQNYGVFKSVYRRNLEKLVQDRCEMGVRKSLGLSHVGLLIFGGEDPETGRGYQSAFEEGFSKAKCKEAWEKVGAAPLTRKCLESEKVRHELGVEGDPMASKYQAMQAENDRAVHWLNLNGLRGDLLAAKVDTKVVSAFPLTSKGSKERQELLKRSSKTAGNRFEILRGSHLSHDDLQISNILASNELELKQMEKDKKDRVAKKERDTEARGLLEIDANDLQLKHLKILLQWQGLKKIPSTKQPCLQKWLEVKDNTPPVFVEWTPEEEAKMVQLRSTDINIQETAIGRQQKVVWREMTLQFDTMSPEEQLKYIEELEQRRNNGLPSQTAQI